MNPSGRNISQDLQAKHSQPLQRAHDAHYQLHSAFIPYPEKALAEISENEKNNVNSLEELTVQNVSQNSSK